MGDKTLASRIMWRLKNFFKLLKLKKINGNPEPNEADFEFLKKHFPMDFYKKSRERDKRIFKTISPDHIVLTGPFKGMIYPNLDTKDYNLVSKIVGSYESELHQVVNQICKTPYDEIINVGSAEGYYAIGLARNIPGATVYAYDIDEYSLDLCRQTAVANNVQDRMQFRGFCSAETLANFPFKGKTLIVTDCEGYEKELFSENTVPHLAHCDILVELHDCLVPGVTSAILTRFAPTHDIHIYSTKDKPIVEHPELSMLNASDRKAALCDNRGNIGEVIFMEWAWLTAKNSK